jgi:hypothetical protein
MSPSKGEGGGGGETPKGGDDGASGTKTKGSKDDSNATSFPGSPSSMEALSDANAASASNDASSTWPLPRWRESLLEAAVETFRMLEMAQQSEWDAECATYEAYEPFLSSSNPATAVTDSAVVDVDVDTSAGKAGERPRRNYVNSLGTVDDPDLYPYHTALYPLLDAYDPLYLDSDDEWEVSTLTILQRQPIRDPETAVPPSFLHPNGRRYRNFYRNVEGDDDESDDDDIGSFEGYSPASAEATVLALLGEDFFFQEPVNGSRVQCIFGVLEDIVLALANKFFSASFRIERELKHRLMTEGRDAADGLVRERDLFLHSVAYEEIALPVNPVLVDRGVDATWRQGRSTHPTVENHPLRSEGWYDPGMRHRHGIEHLPPDRRLRSEVMLKLLRHALSELQRDHRLAAAATFNLMLFRDFDDVSVLAKFLAICDREFGERLDRVYDAMFAEDNQGEQEPVNPIRHEIYKFGRNISWMVAVGMVRVTRPHAVALAGYCRRVFEREMGHLHTERHLHKARKGGGGGAAAEEEPPAPTSFRERQRWSAKRYAFLRAAEEDKDAAFSASAPCWRSAGCSSTWTERRRTPRRTTLTELSRMTCWLSPSSLSTTASSPWWTLGRQSSSTCRRASASTA